MLYFGFLSDSQPPVDVPIPELSSTNEILNIGVDTTSSTAWWWDVHKASDFPEITGVTKDYFVLWSSDHATEGTFWGEMNNLDFSDFTEMGQVTLDGWSDETPRLYRIEDAPDDEKIHLFYHSKDDITNAQRTILYTTAGGSLTNLDSNGSWTFQGEPIVKAGGEFHTGYFVMLADEYGTAFKNNDGYYQASHVLKGSDDFTLDSALLGRSLSNDGRTWWRTEPRVNSDSLDINPEKISIIKDERFLTIQNVNVQFTGYYPYIDSVYQRNRVQICIAVCDDNHVQETIIKDLTIDQEKYFDTTSYYDRSNKILHFYLTGKELGASQATKLYHGTLDMNDADKWIGINKPIINYPARPTIQSIELTNEVNGRMTIVIDVPNTGDDTDLDDLVFNLYRNNDISTIWKIAGSINNPNTAEYVLSIARDGTTFTIIGMIAGDNVQYHFTMTATNDLGNEGLKGNQFDFIYVT